MNPAVMRKVVAAAVCGFVLVAPEILPLDPPDRTFLLRRNRGPAIIEIEPGPPLGTDDAGRCILARTTSGARVSMLAALAGGVVSMAIGIGVGVFSGWRGGRVDRWTMRIVDAADAVPSVVVVVLAQAWIRSAGGPLGGRDARAAALFAVLGLATWFVTARLVRAQTASLRGKGFVEAAIASGIPESRVVLRHVLPNLRGLVAACAAITIPRLVLFEAFLSFLGLGVEAPRISLGSLARSGFDSLSAIDPRWTPLVAPCVGLVVVSWAAGSLADPSRVELTEGARAA